MERNFDLFMLKQEEVENKNLPLFCEYAIDFRTCQPIFENGDIKVLQGTEALQVWIFRAVKTERNKYLAHSENYGSDLLENISTIYNESIKQVLIEQQIKDCLLVNPYLLDVYDFKFTKLENDVKVEFSVDTIYGAYRQEVIGIEY